MAEALTMKRTIATKMIVMSNEFRTRGNMPGAMRSETITRSSAWAAITTSRVDAIAAIVALEARVTQELRQELRSNRNRREEDVFVGSVCAAALPTEPVEHRDADRADDVPVGPAARRLLFEREPELAAVLPRSLEQPCGAVRSLERRTRPAAAELEPCLRLHRFELGERALDLVAIGHRRDPYVHTCLRLGQERQRDRRRVPGPE